MFSETGFIYSLKRVRSSHALQLVEKGHFSVAFFSSYHPTCSKMYVG